MTFRHKNIRLRHENYIGKGWFFVTLCSANRRKLFVTAKLCGWLLDIVRHNAAPHAYAVHAYCWMPDHAHLLLEGLAPTSDLLNSFEPSKPKPRHLSSKRTTSHSGKKNSTITSCVATT